MRATTTTTTTNTAATAASCASTTTSHLPRVVTATVMAAALTTSTTTSHLLSVVTTTTTTAPTPTNSSKLLGPTVAGTAPASRLKESVTRTNSDSMTWMFSNEHFGKKHDTSTTTSHLPRVVSATATSNTTTT